MNQQQQRILHALQHNLTIPKPSPSTSNDSSTIHQQTAQIAKLFLVQKLIDEFNANPTVTPDEFLDYLFAVINQF
jgi:hypothetical protein